MYISAWQYTRTRIHEYVADRLPSLVAVKRTQFRDAGRGDAGGMGQSLVIIVDPRSRVVRIAFSHLSLYDPGRKKKRTHGRVAGSRQSSALRARQNARSTAKFQRNLVSRSETSRRCSSLANADPFLRRANRAYKYLCTCRECTVTPVFAHASEHAQNPIFIGNRRYIPPKLSLQKKVTQ